MFSRKTPRPSETPASSLTVTEAPTPAPRPTGVPSIISPDMTIRGDLTGGGDLQIEGKVVGRVDIGHLVIAEGGCVEGEVLAHAVRVSGTVTGSIRASSVALTKTARVQGDIYHEVLAIEAGAQLEGQCRRITAGAAPEPNKLLDAPQAPAEPVFEEFGAS